MSPHILLFPKCEPAKLIPTFLFVNRTDKEFKKDFWDVTEPIFIFLNRTDKEFKMEFSGLSFPFTYSIL